MKAPAPARRDRLREMLADLKMPGALEAVDGILSEADSGTLSRPRPSSSCSTPRSCCATTVASRPPCAPRGCRR